MVFLKPLFNHFTRVLFFVVSGYARALYDTWQRASRWPIGILKSQCASTLNFKYIQEFILVNQ